MIHDEICTYEVAKLAKEKGFDVPTRTIKVEKIEGTEKEVWDEEECRYITQWETRSVRIPTQSLLQRWLREEKNVQIIIKPTLDELGAWIWGHYSWVIFIFNECRPIYYSIYNGDNSTYELALEDALKYALEKLV